MARAYRESGIGMQARVLFALVLREMATRYGRSSGGYIWALVEPAGSIAILAAIFSQITRHPPLGASFAFFFATGYLAFHIYLDISRAVSASVKVNRTLLSFPRVTMLDTIIARFLLQFLTSIAVFAIIIYGVSLVTGEKIRVDLAAVFSSLMMASMLGLGVGAVNCIFFAFSPTWERIFGVINRPMFIISGIFYTYEMMPRAIQDVLWWNPLIHVTATMRAAFYPYYAPSFVSPTYVYAIALSLLAAAVLLLRLLRAQMLERP